MLHEFGKFETNGGRQISFSLNDEQNEIGGRKTEFLCEETMGKRSVPGFCVGNKRLQIAAEIGVFIDICHSQPLDNFN
jgi:hypothetical protein